MNGLRIFCCFLVFLHATRACIRSGFSSSGGGVTDSGTSGDTGTSQDNGGAVEDNEPVTGDSTNGNDNTEDGSDGDTSTLPGCPTIISRSQWGARAPKSKTAMRSTPLYVVIHHGAGARCYTGDKCQEKVQEYQNLHMDTRKWSDIGYNFIVGEDGNVYEGRGWGIRGAHAGTSALNEKSLGICVIGDFSNTVPNEAAQSAVKKLITCARSNDKLVSTYTIRAHRDLKSTECPGQHFYDVIKTWYRYSESDGVDASTREDDVTSGSNTDNTDNTVGNTDSSTGINQLVLPGCPTIISRAGWDARAPRRRTQMSALPSYVLIHHGTGNRCDTKSSCTSSVQGYQRLHMNTNKWIDIGYNFIVGEDGNVYEGRGWGITGAHAGKNLYNRNSLGICVIGDFSNSVPNDAALTAIQQLISCSVANNKLEPSYTLLGHRDVKATECPGKSLYDVVKAWPKF